MLTVYCRLCLNPSQLNEIVSLFATYKGFSICDALLDLFQIKILPTETLSSICKQCVAKVCTVRDIREEFITQDRKYQQMISGSSEEESPQTEQQNAPKDTDAEPPPKAAGTTEEQELGQAEDIKSVECLELSEVKENITTDNGDSNSIICYVEQSNDTDGQETPESDFEVMLIPGSPGKSPIRYEISGCPVQDNCSSEELDVFEPKIKEDNHPEYCAYTEDTSEPAVAHDGKEMVNSTNLYVCEWCENYYDTCDAYMAHVCPKRSEGTEVNESQIKKRRIVSRSNAKTLEKAKKRTEVQTNIICPHCSAVFHKDKQLLRHGKTKHPDQFQVICCNECNDEFATSNALDEHVWLKHRTGYQCKFCKKKLPNTFALESHENVHTKRQTFSCSVCNKMFSQYTSLWRHKLIHNDIKAYECDLCQRRFRQRTVMLAHRLIHTGEKPYICEICDRSFRDRSTLARHGQTHTKLKTTRKRETWN
ncbi:zinc finger protein 70-like [Anopheles funestus]|uniref:Protein krueppel n=1 Tax=Anopheles funestus TaxID=62324 RepID=A0A4Y0BQL5_ANOFN|nr:zinc finger protein 70-like [Anopheles funestus]